MWLTVLAVGVVVLLYLALLVAAVCYLPDDLDGPEGDE
jgi:hypothetical protein